MAYMFNIRQRQLRTDIARAREGGAGTDEGKRVAQAAEEDQAEREADVA